MLSYCFKNIVSCLMNSYVLGFLVSFFICVIATPFVKLLAIKFHLVDDPKKRYQPAGIHDGVVPRAGGLAIYLAIFFGIVLLVGVNKVILGILIGGVLIVAMGLADDYKDISPYTRWVMNIIVAVITISFGLGIPYVSNPFGGVIHLDKIYFTISFLGTHNFLIIANIISVIWIVALMNFVNWSKGVDGQMPGFVAISAFIIALFAVRFSSHDIAKNSVSMIGFITSGAFAGFLVWNMYPQKIMPGYSGGALAGFMLAVLSILSFSKFGILLMVLSVPLIDAVYVFMGRVLSRKSPFKGDNRHFHHRLLQIGWGKRRVAVFYWTVCLLFGISSLYFTGVQKVLAFGSTMILLAFFIVILIRIKKGQTDH